MASEIDFALKNIQAKVVKLKVIPIFNTSFLLGNNLPFATISIFFLFVWSNIEGKINKALINPQIIKVQFAPCQKPLTINIINIFMDIRKLDLTTNKFNMLNLFDIFVWVDVIN